MKTLFLKQLVNLKWDKPCIPDELYDFVPEFIHASITSSRRNHTNAFSEAQTLRDTDDDENGIQLASIMMFLPGIYEIGRMHTALTKFQKYVSLVIYALFTLYFNFFFNFYLL